MTANAIVTVVIPCFNAEFTLARAVDSVLANRPYVHQIILVENNSTDGTKNECERLVALHNGIISLHFESTSGACNARNKGLEFVDTEWVQFLDADDTILPTKLRKQLSFGIENDFDVIVSPFEMVFENGTILKSAEPQLPPELGLMRGSLGTTGANLFRTKSVRNIDGWNPKWSSAQEYELMFRLYLDGAKFGAHHQRLFKYSAGREGSISSGNPRDLRTNSLVLRRKMLEKFISSDMEVHDKQLLYNGLFNQIRWSYFENRMQAEESWTFLKELGYIPSKDHSLPLVYCWLVRVSGLRFAENLRRLFQKLRKG
jgi:glycosyltransferase involved in cell wall biosynthesis